MFWVRWVVWHWLAPLFIACLSWLTLKDFQQSALSNDCKISPLLPKGILMVRHVEDWWVIVWDGVKRDWPKGNDFVRLCKPILRLLSVGDPFRSLVHKS